MCNIVAILAIYGIIVFILCMQKSIGVIKKYLYPILFCSVVLIGIFFRAYNFIDRVDYGSDTARDILIAQEALKIHSLPLFASFSSTGPYVFGPQFYWTNMLSFYIFPSSIAPFLLLFLTGVLSIGAMMHAGKLLGGEKLSITVGLLAAFSPQFISRSISLTQHSYLGHLSIFSLLFFVLLLKQKKIIYSFILGLLVGLATMFHYAGINLAIFSIFIPFIPGISFRKKFLFLLSFFVGFFIMWLPLLYWDSQQNFANFRNFLDFIFIGQNRIYVPNSWRLFLFNFLPTYWGNVVGGFYQLAFLIFSAFIVLLGLSVLKRKLTSDWIIVYLIFFSLLVINRYYKGERFDGYVIYLAPFIFISTAWTATQFSNLFKGKKNNFKLLEYLILIIILTGSFFNAKQFIFFKNYHMENILRDEQTLKSTFPNRSFTLYDYLYRSTDKSHALSVMLQHDGLSNPRGIPIGIADASTFSVDKKLFIKNSSFILLDPKKIDVNSRDWKRKNQEDVYEDSIGWSKNTKLQSTFNPLDFLRQKLFKN